jgi:predicted RNase H-like HicB family nuclease
MKKYKLIIEKNQDGFWGQVEKLTSIFSSGETVDELIINTKEAISLYFETIGKPHPRYELELVMDIQGFFEINDYINISTLAKRIGMNASLLRQYSKGLKFPSLKQVGKIEQEIRKIGGELSQTELQPA